MLILTAAGWGHGIVKVKVGLKCALLYLGGCVPSFMEKGGGQRRWKLKERREKCWRVLFFPYGCRGLEKTRQWIGVKVLGGGGGNQFMYWEIWGFVVAPALKDYQQICCSHPTAHISAISKHTCNPPPNTTTFASLHVSESYLKIKNF